MKNCAILLAGGKSRRMGKDKAFLKLCGRSFLDIQLDKLCRMDLEEILISGDPQILSAPVAETCIDKRIRIIPDTVTDKGPLGGLYSCFTNTCCDNALVISIDVPLISERTLSGIISFHDDNKYDATVLTAASHIEPLIAVYSTGTKNIIRKLLDDDDLSIRSLLDRIDTYYLEFDGNPSELYNCNTSSDYSRLTDL